GLRLEVTAESPGLDEHRQPALPRCLDLTLVLPELGGNVSEAEVVVDLLLGAARHPPRSPQEAVLVQLELPLDGELAEHHVVRLAAGEVEERGPEALRGHDAQIDLQAGGELHAALGAPPSEHASDLGDAREGAHDRLRLA